MKPAYQNSSLPVEKRVSDLLRRMTQAEKIGQLQQICGSEAEKKQQFLQQVREGRIGSLLNLTGSWVPDLVRVANEFQRVAVEETRLGIPLLIGRDVIHGCRTMQPIPLGQAATFDTALVEAGAAAAATEATAYGINWAFSPMVDIARDPRWGRIAEGAGEDPLLTARMGVAMVRGYQGDDLSAPGRLAACAKHFVAYGAAEGGRDYNTTWVPDVLLRNLYLMPFRACVDAGVATIMSGFHCLNGVPASGNCFTIRQVLQREWGFDGMTVSDWGSVDEMIKHGYVADRPGAAAAALQAGVDMEMGTTTYAESLADLIRERRVTPAMLDEAVRRILRLKFRLGLFERSQTAEARQAVIGSADIRAVARRLAVESCVLLKNDGVLPLRRTIRKLALIGPLADAPYEQMGMWTMDGLPGDTVTVLAALRERLAGRCEVRHVAGLPEARSVDPTGFGAARKAAAAADAVVLVLGEPAYLSGEAHSRASLDLPGAQLQLLEAVAAAGKPVVLVVMAGRPLVLTNLPDRVHALLWAWHPGTMGGAAIADLLFGDETPSGKLPVSLPACVGQLPVYYNRLNTGRPPVDNQSPVVPEGTPLNPIGYSSTYVDASHQPLFAFGFGLSYTTFGYANLKLSARKLHPDGTLKVACDLTNTGRRDGDEVVQLYLRDVVSSIVRPIRELKGFQRVRLAAGETRRVTFHLTRSDLCCLDAAGRELLEPGRFQVWVGGSSEATLMAEFELQG